MADAPEPGEVGAGLQSGTRTAPSTEEQHMSVIWFGTGPERDARRGCERWVSALLREREGYVSKGLTDRVRQVDEQLARYVCEGGPEE